MDTATRIGLVVGVLGLGVAIIAIFAPYEWRNMSAWIRGIGLITGSALIGLSVVLLLVLPAQEFPEITLRFVAHDEPLLQLANGTNVVARNIKWLILAWNVSRLSTSDQPLQIPASQFDFLVSHSMSAPISIFTTPLVKPSVNKGDIIIGSASVDCPDCKRGNTYIFWIKLGSGGWFYLVPDIYNGNVLTPGSTATMLNDLQQIAAIAPSEQRIEISDPPPSSQPVATPPSPTRPATPPGKSRRPFRHSTYSRWTPWSL